MRSLCAVMAVALLSGCITERRATFPSPAPVHDPLPVVDRAWALGQVFVSVAPGGTNRNVENWAPARRQIQDRLAQTLRDQSIGRRVDSRSAADVVVDVDIEMTEQRGLNAWFVPALLTGTAVLVGGAIAGAVLMNRDPDAAYSAPGMLLGEAAAVGPAIALESLFPAATVTGTADATLTFRRASDGVAIFQKRARANWSQKHNGYFLEEKLAGITGAGATLLEQHVLAALHEGLLTAPEQNVHDPVSEAFTSDVPRKFVPFAEVHR